jgi:hypothetical protein
MPQWPCDWWDNTHIVLRETNHDILVFDVEKRTASLLVSADDIQTFLKSNGVAIGPKHDQTMQASGQKISFPPRADPFAIRNGRENDFFITDLHQRWLAEESFLLGLERPAGRLKLISQAFKFEWSDHFTPNRHYYLYTGRESGKGSDGVFLRDLAAGTNRVLVAPAGAAYFSLPGFYKDSVIYLRSNVFWRINLDGSENVRLFPPPETGRTGVPSGPSGTNGG